MFRVVFVLVTLIVLECAAQDLHPEVEPLDDAVTEMRIRCDECRQICDIFDFLWLPLQPEDKVLMCPTVVPECYGCAEGTNCVIHGQTHERCAYAACE